MNENKKNSYTLIIQFFTLVMKKGILLVTMKT